MTNKNRIKLPIMLLVFTVAAIILSGCGDGTTFRLSEDDIDYLASSYIMLRGDEELPESRAAWNAMTDAFLFPDETETSTTAVSQNYPEKGQRTTATITKTDTAGIYLVTNVTEYPRKENILSKTTESYYVNDNISADGGMYTFTDPLWDKEGGVPDYEKRVTYQTEYQNGTVRYEAVEAAHTEADPVHYAAFDISGTLDYPETLWSPTDDTGAADQSNYSSRVRYIQKEGSNFSYWPENKIIIGARYYTEHGVPVTKPTKTSVAYEKVIKTDTALTDLENKIGDYSGRLFTDATGDITLAETVIRYEIQPNGKKTVNSKTVIYNEAGTVVATLDASYLEDETGKVTKPGKPVATYK